MYFNAVVLCFIGLVQVFSQHFVIVQVSNPTKDNKMCCFMHKGKLACLGSNDSYVVIGLGREKYQTSVQERTLDPEWQEECDL